MKIKLNYDKILSAIKSDTTNATVKAYAKDRYTLEAADYDECGEPQNSYTRAISKDINLDIREDVIIFLCINNESFYLKSAYPISYSMKMNKPNILLHFMKNKYVHRLVVIGEHYEVFRNDFKNVIHNEQTLPPLQKKRKFARK